MTNVILNNRIEIAIELHSFFEEYCINKKTRIFSLPFSFRSRVIGKEIFKRMNPELISDLKSYRIDLHRKNISGISHMVGIIFSMCEAKKEFGQFLVNDTVISNLKLYIKNNS